jgi:predicted nucleotidyltransferase
MIKNDARRQIKGWRAAAERVRGTGLADALFSTTQQRVLRLLYGQPERTFFANELISLLRSGSGAVQRELARLAESGLVHSRMVGRQRHYQANADAPIFEELRRIVLKTFGAADPLREALEPLKDRIAFAALFGSVAKGTDSAASDFDVLIVSDHLMLEDLYAALEPTERLLGRKINPLLVNSAELKSRKKDSFLRKVLSGPMVPLIGSGSWIEARHEATR